MHEPCFGEQPTLTSEIDWDGRKVRASAWYGTNTGPEDTGFGIIRHIGLDPRVRGMPVIKATVDSSGHGYENNFGWIQIIARLGDDGAVIDWGPDPFPALRDRGVPFTVLGYHPTFFDAPFWPDRPKIRWRADLFLCPIVVRRPSEEPIFPLTGFRWGFEIVTDRGEPTPFPLTSIGREQWQESLPRFRYWFPGWRFEDGPR